ncbi:50S ribosomal protein L31 [candidate division WWE3 bacterium]|nr:50S ribosomal protein L31 [candidate division WWE3 bacterium]
MKKGIHPIYHDPVQITCACGGSIAAGSVLGGSIRVDICSQCHPFFTGEKRLVDTAGQVEKFERRTEKATTIQSETIERPTTSNKKKKEKDTPQRVLSLRELLEQART